MSEVIVTIATTAAKPDLRDIYISAVRLIDGYKVVSLQVTSSVNYIKLVSSLVGQSKFVFVDVEKKQDLDKSLEGGHAGNLYRRIYEARNELGLEKQLELLPIKMNDITCSAVFESLFKRFGDISGLNASLVGVGNIGFKLALLLTESGARVRLYNRTSEKSFVCAKAISYFKPLHTIASPEVCVDMLHTFSNADFSIIAASELSKPLDNVVKLAKPMLPIYLLGHSMLSQETLEVLASHQITPIRVDVGPALLSHILGGIQTYKYDMYGETRWNDASYCSGGFIGSKGSYIVDNHMNPRYLYGTCDGNGGVDISTKQDRLSEGLIETSSFSTDSLDLSTF